LGKIKSLPTPIKINFKDLPRRKISGKKFTNEFGVSRIGVGKVNRLRLTGSEQFMIKNRFFASLDVPRTNILEECKIYDFDKHTSFIRLFSLYKENVKIQSNKKKVFQKNNMFGFLNYRYNLSN
jgi:biotin operon repressor